ncbi:MAG TPA: hypothetical protein VMK84_12025, partial [Streptosporangiaceae bacterium]|nr:hypothetical protein [Streptosporangiaceae bacterium]
LDGQRTRALACESGTARGTGGVRQKLARVLEAQSTAPQVPVPGVRLIRGLIRDQRRNDVTGGTAGYFPAGTAPRAAASGADPKIEPQLGARQQPAAEPSAGGWRARQVLASRV